MIFAFYMTLFVAVLINQMESRSKFHVNHEIDDTIENLHWRNRTYTVNLESDDTLVNAVSLNNLKDMSDVVIFVQEILPTLPN